jgi:zinc D-Ala-D-Ala dipeptidase
MAVKVASLNKRNPEKPYEPRMFNYKIVLNLQFIFAVCMCFTLFSFNLSIAQESYPAIEPPQSPMNKEKISGEISILEGRLIEEGLVDIQMLDPSIRVDLKYAKSHNFMGRNVYGKLTRAYLRPAAASKIVKASTVLQESHPELLLLVVDAVRPRSVQHKMWEIVVDTPMQRYIANPYRGSVHNYGAAVDVSLYNVETGKQLDMGTPVDYFGPLAHPNLEHEFLQEGKLTEEQIENRLILRNAMCDAGWIMLPIEWWHFNAFPLYYIRENYSIIE